MGGLVQGAEFIWALVLMLGVLITVHEFGHFIVAKACGVKVLKFSIGFGPAIGFGRYRLSFTRGETEYVIAWFPLGGFVKMLGEVPGEESTAETQAEWDRSLGARPVWQKLAIILAGPAMNLVLPVFVVMGFLWVGSQQPLSVVGTVEPGSPAANAGIRPGDRVTAIDQEPVKWWSELADAIEPAAGGPLALTVERDGKSFDTTVAVAPRTRLDFMLAQEERGWIGIQSARQRPVVGVISLTSPAANAGIRSGDEVQTVAGQAVDDWSSFAAAYAMAGDRVQLSVVRGPEGEEETLEIDVPGLGSVDRLGVIPSVVLIQEVSEGTPAERAGLAGGDLIMAVDGAAVGSFLTFQETVMASGGRDLQVQFARDGETRVATLAPQRRTIDIDGNEIEVFQIGIRAVMSVAPGAMELERYTDPRDAFPRAVSRVAGVTGMIIQSFGRLLDGSISRKELGGPIEIARQSHKAMEAGWERFLSLLIVISINLAVLNMLPIPVLDGGQAVLFLIEGVKRSAVSVRTREIAQVGGLFLVLSLMGLALWNDLSKYWSSFVDWLVGL